ERFPSQASSPLTVVKRLPTITPKNLTISESEDVLTLTCTVGYTNFGAVFWTLYDRDLKGIGHVEESNAALEDGKTVAKVSVLRIGGWQVLPTDTGVYPFKCNTFADFKVASDTALVRSNLTDTCGGPGAVPGKCEARGARCVDNHCACLDDRHPFKLPSVHTVCWPEAKLGAQCYFQEQCSTPQSDCMVPLGWCACKQGYGRSLDASRCEPRASGQPRARCAKHADCATSNAQCVYSHCECAQGLVASPGEPAVCMNATTAPQAELAGPSNVPMSLAPQTALQQGQQLAPEAPSFGHPHKHIRDAPIAVE
ncbi:unnamed protein product, partial [Ixodes hexagonus]